MLRSILNTCRKAAQGLAAGAGMDPAPVVLFNFNSPKVVDAWHVFTDAYFGGKSQAALKYNAEEQAAEFSGRVTLEQEEDADIKRAGYCVASSKVNYIGEYFDLSGCSHLVVDAKGDGRTYIANVRVDSIAGTGGDVWQAPFPTLAGKWSRVSIPLQSLALTYQGQLVERRLEFQAEKVISVGVAVSAMPSTDASSSTDIDAGSSIAGTATSSTSSSHHTPSVAEADGFGGKASASETPGGSSSSSIIGSSRDDDSSSSLAAGSSVSEQDSQLVPEEELFRLLIRSIKAEVQW